ncbi:unnamed protein product [Adineta ricciae]|uniref:G-protein coupled receptors family 1 profile domain-containing protein n=1 Tax=Adineta ricciae TaxID=249248 RepID=A0A814W732_ADIRI|nr:unnamed protein product [Adineta ricciae]CAF1525933.1 unnamed protein product [Adineta ricciae]
MNETTTIFTGYSFHLPIESWFIPVGICTLLCLLLSTFFSVACFLQILFDKTCHTIPMLLVGNSYFIAILFGIDQIYTRCFTLFNDYQRIQYQDLLCNFRGYFGYATCSIQNSSYLLQAVYRYVTIVYPTRFVLQSIRFQLFLITLTWLIGLLYPIAFLFTNEIVYNIDNQICQLPLKLSFSIIYMASGAYIIPVLLTIFVYFKLILYVKLMGKRVTSVNALLRAQRQLKMVRRIVILVSILFILCFPYAMFIFFSFFMTIPKYNLRISYVFIDVSFIAVVIILFQFTEPLKTSMTRKVKIHNIVPIPSIQS